MTRGKSRQFLENQQGCVWKERDKSNQSNHTLTSNSNLNRKEGNKEGDVQTSNSQACQTNGIDRVNDHGKSWAERVET